jgi:prepilin-type N-terminal cleavage/methylation domain-containing protein
MSRLTISRRCRRRGFSLIELLTVMAVIGLLAAIGIPRYQEMKRRAYLASVASDFNAIRVAAYNYFADHSTYPPDGASGIPPAVLVPYLPQNFSFSGPRYTLDYDAWPSPLNPSQMIIGVTVTAGDQELVNMIARSIRAGGIGLNVGNGYTYIFAGL